MPGLGQLVGWVLDHAPTKGKIEANGIANNGDYVPPWLQNRSMVYVQKALSHIYSVSLSVQGGENAYILSQHCWACLHLTLLTGVTG
jgi:hypothetical protein